MSSQTIDEIIKAKDAEISKLLDEIQALKAKIQDQTIISETLDDLEITIDNSQITETIAFKLDEETSNKMQETSKILLMRRKTLKENSKNQENAQIKSKKRKLDKIINPNTWQSRRRFPTSF